MTASVSIRRTLFGLSAVLYAFLYAPVIVVIIYSFNNARLESREWAHVSNAVPRVQLTGRFAFGFVAFEKARH